MTRSPRCEPLLPTPPHINKLEGAPAVNATWPARSIPWVATPILDVWWGVTNRAFFKSGEPLVTAVAAVDAVDAATAGDSRFPTTEGVSVGATGSTIESHDGKAAPDEEE